MGCGASPQRVPRARESDLVSQSKTAEEARMAPLLLRMEKITDLHKEGLMSDIEYHHYRSALLSEIAGNPAPDVSVEKEARQRRAEMLRNQVNQMERLMRNSPDVLPPDYYACLQALPPKFTQEVPEQDEWRHASSAPLQEYYNSYAGKSIDEILADRTTTLDEHRNPVGTQFDLPRDGTMQEHTLLICWFSTEGSYEQPVKALREKGFNVIVHVSRSSTVQQMMVSLLSADVVWIVSGKHVSEISFEQFLDALETFHRRGGGIFVWGDNSPFFAHANQLLARLFPGDGISLEGNDKGSQIMRAHTDGVTPGHLARSHLIFTGLNALFEGVTISFLPRIGPLKAIATYNDGPGYFGKPYCAVADAEVYRRCNAPYKMGRGRLVIDGGYTKLYNEFWSKTAGTARYVKNASTWLLNMNSRIVSEAELSGAHTVGGLHHVSKENLPPPGAHTAGGLQTSMENLLPPSLRNPRSLYRADSTSGQTDHGLRPCEAHRRLHCSSCHR